MTSRPVALALVVLVFLASIGDLAAATREAARPEAAAKTAPRRGMPCTFVSTPPVYVRFGDTVSTEFGPFAFVSVADFGTGMTLSVVFAGAAEAGIMAPSHELAVYDAAENVWRYDFDGRSGESGYWQASALPLPVELAGFEVR